MDRATASEMDQRTVVPKHQVMCLPAMPVDVLGAHAVRVQLGEQLGALVDQRADDADGGIFANE